MKTTLAFLFSFISISMAQSYHPASAPNILYAVTGGNFINTFHAAYNPTNISYLHEVEAAVYAEKKYLTTIDLLVVAAYVPFDTSNGIGFVFQHAGETEFNERIVGVNYGKNFGRINAGVLFQNITVRIVGSPKVSMLQTGMAASLRVTDNSFAGFRILNPSLLRKIKNNRVQAASVYSLSFGWQASSDAYAGFESRKEEGRPMAVYFTVQYQFSENFSGTLHLNTVASQPYAAIGWKLMRFKISAGCSYHPSLGMSPAISFIYTKQD